MVALAVVAGVAVLLVLVAVGVRALRLFVRSLWPH